MSESVLEAKQAPVAHEMTKEELNKERPPIANQNLGKKNQRTKGEKTWNEWTDWSSGDWTNWSSRDWNDWSAAGCRRERQQNHCSPARSREDNGEGASRPDREKSPDSQERFGDSRNKSHKRWVKKDEKPVERADKSSADDVDDLVSKFESSLKISDEPRTDEISTKKNDDTATSKKRDASSAQAPERTVVPARRMILSHLGVKLNAEQRAEEKQFWVRRSDKKVEHKPNSDDKAQRSDEEAQSSDKKKSPARKNQPSTDRK